MQLWQFANVLRPRQDGDVGIELLGLPDDLLVDVARAAREDQVVCPLDTGLHEHVRPHRIAVDSPHVEGFQPAYGVEIEFDHGRLDLVVEQELCHGLAHGTVAHHDRPMAWRRCLQRVAIVTADARPSASDEPALERFDQPIEERVERDRHDCRGDERVDRRFRQHAQLPAERRQNEGKFTDLGQRHGDARRILSRMAKEHDSCPDREGLGEQHDRQGGGQQPRRGEDRCGVEQHADRHEKQHGECIPHRQSLGGGAQSELAASHDRSCEKRPQCHGDAEELGGADGDAQCDHEHREREELS